MQDFELFAEKIAIATLCGIVILDIQRRSWAKVHIRASPLYFF
jgi:hypothetical protein